MLVASLCSVQMKDVDMYFYNDIDHKFVNTATQKDLYAGYQPDFMEL